MGYFTQMRWIDAGARSGVTAWLVRYEERILQFFWTFVGLICAAILHAMVNIYASLGGQGLAIVIMMSSWTLFIFYLIRPASGRPYGTIIRKVDLLRQIVEAEECLDDLQKQTEPSDASTVPQKSKTRKSPKQFAKG